MGTAGGSGADPGRGTHSRSELTTPHLSHLAQALNVQQLLKKKNLAFFGRFWPISGPGPARPGWRSPATRGTGPVVVVARPADWGPLIAQ